MNPARRSSRGYTIIELFAVVTIVGVLSAIAIYGMNRYLRYAKSAEAGEVLGSIRAGEEAYFEETFRYLDVTSTDFYPAPLTVLGDTKVQWGDASAVGGGCAGCRDRFLTLGVTVNQPVVFRYMVQAATTGSPAALLPSVSLNTAPFAAVDANPGNYSSQFYVAVAASDIDAAGGELSVAIASPFQAELYTEDLGE